MTSDEKDQRIAELEKVIMVMAEKIYLMSTHLSKLSIKKELRCETTNDTNSSSVTA